MADYHNLGVKPYQNIFIGIEKMGQNNLWFTESNFREGQDRMEFYYVWFRIIRFLRTIHDYSVQYESRKTKPNYTIECHSDLSSAFLGEYPRIIIEEQYYNRIIIHTNIKSFVISNQEYVDISTIKPVSYVLQQVIELCLMSLWHYYNPFIDSLNSVQKAYFCNKCGIIAQS